jgi:hypothetical protein
MNTDLAEDLRHYPLALQYLYYVRGTKA